MSIAIIGAGRMGKGLARVLEQAGEDVVLLGRGGVVPIEVAVVILAVPHSESGNALAAAGDLSGKILVDLTNPIGAGLTLSIGLTTSAAEEIQKRVPSAKVVKAFNTVFAELLDLDYEAGSNPPQVLFAGDDDAAKAEVMRLIEVIGFESYDCGPLANARYLEPIGGLIVSLGYGLGRGTRIAPRLDQY